MGLRINTNISAMNAHRNATINNLGLDKSINSLSSGLRVNKSADDASGLSIANKLSAQSQGLGQAIRNANDAIGLIQTADGAMEEYGNIMKRVRVLAVQASNDTQNATTRGYISQEVVALLDEASNIASSTKFHGVSVLDGTGGANSNGTFVFHVGAYNSDTQSVAIGSASLAAIGATAGAALVTTQTAAEATISTIDTAIQNIHDKRSTLGSSQNKLESIIRNISVTKVNVKSAESQIRDVDFAAESASFAKHNIIAQSGSYALSQANAVQQNVTRLFQ